MRKEQQNKGGGRGQQYLVDLKKKRRSFPVVRSEEKERVLKGKVSGATCLHNSRAARRMGPLNCAGWLP